MSGEECSGRSVSGDHLESLRLEFRAESEHCRGLARIPGATRLVIDKLGHGLQESVAGALVACRIGAVSVALEQFHDGLHVSVFALPGSDAEGLDRLVEKLGKLGRSVVRIGRRGELRCLRGCYLFPVALAQKLVEHVTGLPIGDAGVSEDAPCFHRLRPCIGPGVDPGAARERVTVKLAAVPLGRMLGVAVLHRHVQRIVADDNGCGIVASGGLRSVKRSEKHQLMRHSMTRQDFSRFIPLGLRPDDRPAAECPEGHDAPAAPMRRVAELAEVFEDFGHGVNLVPGAGLPQHCPGIVAHDQAMIVGDQESGRRLHRVRRAIFKVGNWRRQAVMRGDCHGIPLERSGFPAFLDAGTFREGRSGQHERRQGFALVALHPIPPRQGEGFALREFDAGILDRQIVGHFGITPVY